MILRLGVAMEVIRCFFVDDSGATMVEYAIMVALLAIAVAATVIMVSTAINATFNKVILCIGTPNDANCGAS